MKPKSATMIDLGRCCTSFLVATLSSFSPWQVCKLRSSNEARFRSCCMRRMSTEQATFVTPQQQFNTPQQCSRWRSQLVENRASKKSTIFALSSGQLPCGIAIIRISGPSSFQTLRRLIPTSRHGVISPRHLFYTPILHPVTAEHLDSGMAVWLPGPNSHTGEDCCELHVHGGMSIVEDLLAAIATLPTNRMAEPGEFTKRAFHNGKLDLTKVEALKDLIYAKTTAQRRLALRQANGELSDVYLRWRAKLVELLANIEAVIDFAEDEHLDPELLQTVLNQTKLLIDEMQSQLKNGKTGEMLRKGVRVAIVGRPNVGKSTLLNLLCDRPAAIVTPLPGTTRDALDVNVALAGYPVTFTDTAGIRDTTDLVEREGVLRAITAMSMADALILMVDAVDIALDSNGDWLQADVCVQRLTNHVSELLRSSRHTDETTTALPSNMLVLLNKIDLLPSSAASFLNQLPDQIYIPNMDCTANLYHVSCQERVNVDTFLTKLGQEVEKLCSLCLSGDVTFSHVRHRLHIQNSLSHLERFVSIPDQDLVIAAEHLRAAANEVGKIAGIVSVDEVLDKIFSDFCIGK